MKGYTKLTAALAAFVLLFIAIGVSTPTASAATVVLSVSPTSATTLASTDKQKNNTICSSSTCVTSGDSEFRVTVTDSGANLSATEIDTITVSVKNADLATVTPASSRDANAKTITLTEVVSTSVFTKANNTGVFSRVVSSKHGSTDLSPDRGRSDLASVLVSAGTTTNLTSLDLDNVNTGQNTVLVPAAVQTLLITAKVLVKTADGAAPEGEESVITAVAGDGSFTMAPALTAALGAGDTVIVLTPKVQAKAFTGNTITTTYKPTGSLGVSKSIKVDNVKPTLLVTSPETGHITKGNKDVVFTADITDTGAKFPSIASGVVNNNNADTKGRIQLYVGTNVVSLTSASYTAIDDGWRLSVTVNSTDIANIAAKVPWWIVVEDLAGNVQQPSAGTASTTTTAGLTTTVIDSAYIGLPNALFVGRTIKRTIAGVASSKAISAFDGTTGTFTTAAFSAVSAVGSTYEIAKTGLITVDSTAPKVASTADVQTGHNWSAGSAAGARLKTGTSAKTTSIRVTFTDASGLDGTTVTPASFSATGNTVTATLLVDVAGENAAAPKQRIPNDVFLTLETALASSARPTVSVSSGVIKDKAGNAVTGGSYKATDKLGPGLALAIDNSLSKKQVKLTITTDEQLNESPVVELRTMTSATAGTLSLLLGGVAFVDADTDLADDNSGLLAAAHATALAGMPPTVPSVSQSAALTYTYTTKIASIPATLTGAEYNVYVTGNDTSSNPGKKGHKTDATSTSAVTFELDRYLNGGKAPKVSVSDQVATVGTAVSGPKVEAVDPMIVTVDFNRRCTTNACDGLNSDAKGESAEYTRDSNKTVSLTSASLKVIFSNGTSETTTFDLSTEVSSPDNKRFTIPVMSPKVGKYQLTVKAADEAGNNSLTNPLASSAQSLKYSWQVTAAKPVKLALSPGWNLVSLPFQPANPATNSVIPTTHPADIVMTFDNANQVWLVSRRDADTGLFAGDVAVMTANTAYFVRTDNFQDLSILRPPVATAAAAPPPPPAIGVVAGWNLVPVVSLAIPLPKGIDADSYFGTLQSGANVGWLKAMTFSPLTRTWTSVTPKTNENVFTATGQDFTDSCGVSTTSTAAFASETIKTQVCVGKGYWLYASAGGVIIP